MTSVSASRPSGALFYLGAYGSGMSEMKPVLTRGEAIGYNRERMFYRFTMMRGRASVPCEISNAALADLAGRAAGVMIDHETVFLRHRDLIEAVACNLFRRNENIRIFSKHLRRRLGTPSGKNASTT